MGQSGFHDANGQHVTVGDMVEYEKRPGAVGEVTEVHQDGEVTIKWKNLESETVKWGRVAKLPAVVADAFKVNSPSQKHYDFWMVYGSGQRAPTAQHMSEERAMQEAQRLAREVPGVQFFVLKAVGGVVLERPPPPPLTAIIMDPDEVPF